ncbi:MAG: PEP-CTERM sorting domain-containing protein [Terriglobia bacterium]
MKTLKVLALSCFVVLCAWAMGAQTAWAGEMDCALSGGMCGSINFGTQIDSLASPVTGAPGWAGAVTSTVYFDSGDGLFTYVYSFALDTRVGGAPNHFSTFNNGLQELFDPADDFGVVTNMTSSGVTLGPPGFSFNQLDSGTLQVGAVSGLSLTNPDFTFYAQSNLGPGPGTFDGFDGGVGAGKSLDPAVPEPASLALFGTGLLLMGGLLHRKLEANA